MVLFIALESKENCENNSPRERQTTQAIGRAIQNSQESLRLIARRYGIHQKDSRKVKETALHADLPAGPRQAFSTFLSREDKAAIIAFHKHTLLTLNDCLYGLQPQHFAPNTLLVTPMPAAQRHCSAI